jgi:hypothetical protein
MPIQYLDDEEVLPAVPVMRLWLRSLLVLMAVLLIVVFGIAIYLQPYAADGTALRWETHRQLGLPQCTFKELTGYPCPSCGMTTSFALLIRGDVVHSMQANFVGTFLGTFCLILIPWSLASAWRGRYFLILSLEWFLPRLVVVFVVMMLLRWVVVLCVS